MTPHSLSDRIATLPKAELHLHLEGSIQPATVCVLTARHGIVITEEEVRRRYAYRDFPEFIETFKWVTSFLREPQDYALIARDLAEHLFTQHVVYTEVTLSIGVMLLRKQQPEANFEALLRATEQFESRGLRVRWVFDAARQFGAAAAMEVVESAKRCNSKSIVAFGIGGDELSDRLFRIATPPEAIACSLVPRHSRCGSCSEAAYGLNQLFEGSRAGASI